MLGVVQLLLQISQVLFQLFVFFLQLRAFGDNLLILHRELCIRATAAAFDLR